MPITIKGKKDNQEYYPCTIRKYKQYRKKLETIMNRNPNLSFMGALEKPSGKYGFRVKGTDSFGTSEIDFFYSLGDINYYYYKNQEVV